MTNRCRRFWVARSLGSRIGLALMAIDMFLFLIQLAALKAGILPMDVSAEFARLWAATHWPTHEILTPLVWPYLPSHGAGWPGLIAMGVYVVGCGLHAFIVGFALGLILQFLIRHLRGVKA